MADTFFNFQENVKNSFKKAKEDISQIKRELEENKELLIKRNEEIKVLKEKLEEISLFLKKKTKKSPKKSENSIGNEGVYSFIHSFNNYSTTMHSEELQLFGQNLEKQFLSLTKQEFLTFLTIYQLEEDLGTISYSHIASHLKLSEGCIRTYVSSLIRKEIPIIKEKINNRFVILKISPELRDLNLKNKLLDFYYRVDPRQKRLSDQF